MKYEQLLKTLTKVEIGILLRYIRYVQVRANDPSVQTIYRQLISSTRLVISKLEGSSEDFLGDINEWITSSLPGITYEELLDATVAYEWTKKLFNWQQDMIERSTGLTEEEIVEARKTGKSPRKVDVIRTIAKDAAGNKSVVYLTKFNFQVTYKDGRQMIGLVNGDIITPPSLFETMIDLTNTLGVDDVPNEYDIRKDNFLGSLATATEIDPNWKPSDSLSSKLLDAVNFFAKGMTDVLNKLITENSRDGAKAEIQSLLGKTGSVLSSVKWGIYGVFALLSIATTLFSNTGLIVKLTKLDPETVGNLFERLNNGLHIYDTQMSLFKKIKTFTAPGLTTGIFGEGSTASSFADLAIIFAISKGLSKVIGGVKAGWVGIGVEALRGVVDFVKNEISARDLKLKQDLYISLGLAPGGAAYDLMIPLSQLGHLGNPALHNILKKREEYTVDGKIYTGDLSRIRYTADGKSYYDYTWAPEFPTLFPLTRTLPDGTRSPLPEGYIIPAGFYAAAEVNLINTVIANDINEKKKLPPGANNNGIPLPELNPNDIPDLFDPGWSPGNLDWLAAAEEAIRDFRNTPDENGNIAQALRTVKNFNAFITEASKVVLLDDGTLTINFDFLDDQDYTNRYVEEQINQIAIAGYPRNPFIDDVLVEADASGLVSKATLNDGTPVFLVNRTEEPEPLKDTDQTQTSKRKSKAIGRPKPVGKKKIPAVNPTVKPTLIGGRFLPALPIHQFGRTLDQDERNQRRSRTLNYLVTNGEMLDVESTINKNIPATKAEKLYIRKPPPTGRGPIRRGGGSVSSGGSASGGTCFPSYVKVKTKDGYVNISDIMVGDLVISFDVNNKQIPSVVTHKFVHTGDEKSDVYRYKFTNGYSLDITQNHSVLTKTGEFKQIGTVSTDDFLMCDGEWVSITSVKYLGCFEVYNIEVKDNHTYIADGFYVHNAFKNPPGVGIIIPDSGPANDLPGPVEGGGGGGVDGPGGGGGGGEKSLACFPSYAIVSTRLGERKISDTKSGDKLLVYDIKTGQFIIDSVDDVILHTDNTTVFEFILSDGTSIHSTKNHRVLIENNFMKEIGFLSPDDKVIKGGGNIVSVIDSIEIGDMITVYNVKTRSGLPYIVNDLIVQSS